jgi:hypothetical protein
MATTVYSVAAHARHLASIWLSLHLALPPDMAFASIYLVGAEGAVAGKFIIRTLSQKPLR